METFYPTQSYLYARRFKSTNPDYSYWKKLEFPITRKENAAVTHVEFSPIEPYDYAVSSSAKVEIFDSLKHHTVKTFRHFREVAYSGSFRSDGRMLVAGGDEPTIQLFEVALLKLDLKRNLKGHTAPVHLTRFTTDGVRVFSGSDDKTVRVWDIATQSQLLCFNDHQDYVRCGTTNPTSNDLLLTGSYDHTVRLFDTRCQSAVLSVDHGFPIESVVMFPGGGLVVSAGDNFIKVWDVLAGGRLLMSLNSHHKTVTSLGFCSKHQRLVSASLDRHVKFYDVNTYKVVHTLTYPSAILSVAVTPDDSVVAVGMADGLLSLQHRSPNKIVPDCDPKIKRPLTGRFRPTRHKFKNTTTLNFIKRTKKLKLTKYDVYFKHFEYSKALDAAMTLLLRRKSPEITVSVMKELIRRKALKTSLAGRDEKSIKIILQFLLKNLCDQRFNETILDVLEAMLDLYQDEISRSLLLRDMFYQVQFVLNAEKDLAYASMELLGTLDTIMSASASTTTDSD